MGIYVTNGVANTNSKYHRKPVGNGFIDVFDQLRQVPLMLWVCSTLVLMPGRQTTIISAEFLLPTPGAGAANAYGIRLNTSSTVTTTLTGNIVGGTVANSIQSTSTATGTQVAGIFVSTSIATVTSNTITQPDCGRRNGNNHGRIGCRYRFYQCNSDQQCKCRTRFSTSAIRMLRQPLL